MVLGLSCEWTDYCLHLNIHLSQIPPRIHLFHRGSITSHHPNRPIQKKKDQFFFFSSAIKQIFLFRLGVGRRCLTEVTNLIRHYLRPITNWLFAKWFSRTERLDGWHVECYSSAIHPQLFSEKHQWLEHEVTNLLWLRFLWIQIRPRWLSSPLTSRCLSPPLSLPPVQCHCRALSKYVLFMFFVAFQYLAVWQRGIKMCVSAKCQWVKGVEFRAAHTMKHLL